MAAERIVVHAGQRVALGNRTVVLPPPPENATRVPIVGEMAPLRLSYFEATDRYARLPRLGSARLVTNADGDTVAEVRPRLGLRWFGRRRFLAHSRLVLDWRLTPGGRHVPVALLAMPPRFP